MNERRPSDILERYSKVAVIGAGVIGASWTAVFLAHGLSVVVNDPRDDIEAVIEYRFAKPSDAQGFGSLHPESDRKLRFEADLERTVAGADLLQENGPERWNSSKTYGPASSSNRSRTRAAASSSSAKTATEQSAKMKKPRRLLIGHPFNPPHLIPLVEVVPGEQTEPSAVETPLLSIRRLAGPRRSSREIQGFVANRLQRAIFASAAISCWRAWSR